MNPKADELKARTKQFALDVLAFIDTWSHSSSNDHVSYQLCKGATSVAANYRASCRGRSKPQFAAKIGMVLEEADESLFWLEIADARRVGADSERRRLLVEANELTAIFAASSMTVRNSLANAPRRDQTQHARTI